MEIRDQSAHPEKTRGLVWGFASYTLWGLFPLYWKLLSERGSLEILSHRVLWSFVFYLAIFAASQPKALTSLFKQSLRDWKLSAIAAILLTINWGIYIHAVNSGHILEGSLAYFINPIINIAVGVLFFKEPFPFLLKLSVTCAAAGVAAKVWFSPTFPWISIALATTFCAYGVTKKLLKIPARTSSVLEGAATAIPGALAVIYFTATTPPVPPTTWMLFVGGGIVTGLPLFLFSYAAQRVPYSVMGLLQFIAPTLQFLVGAAVYHEPLLPRDLVAFGLIWLGVAFYLVRSYTLQISAR